MNIRCLPKIRRIQSAHNIVVQLNRWRHSRAHSQQRRRCGCFLESNRFTSMLLHVSHCFAIYSGQKGKRIQAIRKSCNRLTDTDRKSQIIST